MKKKNGFTLVELLAVIVVLAIIMVIAIPAVLDVMNTARRKTFVEYMQKVVGDTEKNYVLDSQATIKGAGVYVYDITTDLGYNSTGDFKGYVIVDANMNQGDTPGVDKPHYIVYLYDSNYMIMNSDVTLYGYPDPASTDILAYDSSNQIEHIADGLTACEDHLMDRKNEEQCINRKGYVLSH